MSTYQYQTPSYRAVISTLDADTQKRFGMIEKLSKGFTTIDDLAVQMDKLIMEQLELEGHKSPSGASSEPKASTTTKTKSNSSKSKQSSADLEQIKEGLITIFDELNSKRGGSQVVSASNFTGKIGINQLDDELKKRLNSTTVIQYQLPNQPLSPKVAKSNIPAFQKIVDDVVLGQNVFLVGGAGTGKTTLAQNVTTALGREYMTINCSQWTAPIEIIGGQTLDGYQEGKLIEAWKNGYILILDELPKIDPNTAGLFNDALAKSKIPNSLIFNSRKESFAKHPNFAVIATGNIWPNTESMAYGANNKQDLSLLDRFAGSVYTIEKNFELEQQVVGSLLLWTWCAELRRCIEELKYEAQISMRFMMTCRDTLALEIQRMDASNGIQADEGKTLHDCFMSFMESNFTPVQQDTIKGCFGYGKNGSSLAAINWLIISSKGYQRDKWIVLLRDQLTKSGYLAKKGTAGLGSLDVSTRSYWDGE